jgi:hypothetical protein
VRTIAFGRFAERLLEAAVPGLDARASPDEEYRFPMMLAWTSSLALLLVALITGAVMPHEQPHASRGSVSSRPRIIK